MARQCMKPGCDLPVAARLTYDPVGCAVWLDEPIEDHRGLQQMVCSVHAAGLTAPLGWTLTDRRRSDGLHPVEEPEPRMEPEPEPPTEAPAPSAKVRRRRASARKAKLLDRAFEWTGPQHSVLTHRPEDDPPAES